MDTTPRNMTGVNSHTRLHPQRQPLPTAPLQFFVCVYRFRVFAFVYIVSGFEASDDTLYHVFPPSVQSLVMSVVA